MVTESGRSGRTCHTSALRSECLARVLKFVSFQLPFPRGVLEFCPSRRPDGTVVRVMYGALPEKETCAFQAES